MPWVAAVVGVVGAAVSVAGQIKEGQAQSQAAEFEAEKAKQNATLSIAQAAEDERVFRVSTRKAIGQMRVNVGASGLQLGGSNEDYIAEAAAMGELDALKIRHAGAVKGAGYTSSEGLDRARASAYSTGGYLSAGGTLLSSGSKLYGQYAGV